MTLFTMRPTLATPESIAEAAGRLADGQLVAIPTETVYGLAADATNGRAVAAIYAAKGRPRFNPLIVHVASVEQAGRLIVMTESAERLAAEFWPGPLTLVGRAQQDNDIASLVGAGLDTLAVRMPAHPMARAVIAALGRPVAAPSANRSGRISPTTADHVAGEFGGEVAMILDGGPCGFGVESTILDCSSGTGPPRLLRPGAIAVEAIEATLGTSVTRPAHDPAAPTAPGQLASHYAPRAAVRLNATDVRPGEALLAFGAVAPATAGPVINLSATGDLVEAAHMLFATLRSLDASGAHTIAVMPIPHHDLGEAINDRLARAAAPRG
jgi:L-threonylcarbamoyladenylate synthase